MNIVFMGTPDFAVPSLKSLVTVGHSVVCVVTAPDKPAGRGMEVQSSAVKKSAQDLNLPILQPDNLRDKVFIEQLIKFAADLFVVVAFRILPAQVFTIPQQGTLNLHASLLPKYRGAAPIQWALIHGEHETGVTTFFIDEHVDTGEIILQRKVMIHPEMNAGELHDVLAVAGAELLLQTVTAIENGRCPRTKQEGQVTLAPKITKELCRILWNSSAAGIHNLVRALAPAPGAVAVLHQKPLKILATQPVDIADSSAPGTVIRIDKNGPFYVQTGRGVLSVMRVQPQGKRPISSAEYCRGYPIAAGDRFEENSV